MAKNSEISIVNPIRITKLLLPVTVHSAASPLTCSTSALTSSLNQSISQKAKPARIAFQLRRSTSTEYTYTTSVSNVTVDHWKWPGARSSLSASRVKGSATDSTSASIDAAPAGEGSQVHR